MTIKIDNPEIEHFFKHDLQSDVKKFSEFVLISLKKYRNQKEFNVPKLDPKKNSYKLKFDNLENIDSSDNPFKDISDVKEYAKKLRESSWR